MAFQNIAWLMFELISQPCGGGEELPSTASKRWWSSGAFINAAACLREESWDTESPA